MTPIFAIITGPEIAVLVGIAVLLFGADRIPKLARSMGEAKKEFEAAQRSQPPPAAPVDVQPPMSTPPPTPPQPSATPPPPATPH
ncbi:MAG: twin-arginine translocase TatA/TatE family subunit [Candidatus Eremiobacteraeota bacterium]|nr:twin-arginine translocase TatA/TatE family subunit [Candidatus Eremiobacteraeota bacterium]MBV8667830.1 twin-arginine translocase TatA/TatE family subunit [Candidatus Eremiobacteraeota bacterium]